MTTAPYLTRSQFDSLFDELGSRSWDRMTHCFGIATELPELLRVWLTTTDAGERDDLEAQLLDQLQYQGSTFEASVPATQIIAGALALQKDVRRRQSLVDWLAAMARGYTMTEGQGMLEWVEKDDPKRPDVERQYQRELGWVRDVHSAAWRALPALMTLLRESSDRALSLRVPHAIVGLLVEGANGCPDSERLEAAAREFSEVVRAKYEATNDELLRAGYAFALGALLHLVPANASLLEKALAMGAGASAAVAAMHLAYARPGPDVADVLSFAIRRRSEHTSWFPREQPCPWLRGHFRFALIEALAGSKLSNEDFDRALPSVLDVFGTTTNRFTLDDDVEPVLRRVFGNSKASAATLDHRQRKVLTALYENEDLWDRECGNMMLLMLRIGFDNDRALVSRALGRDV